MPALMKSMNIISRAQSQYRTKKLGILPACHHSLVLAICREPSRSQDELARDICLNKSTVARSLDRLEAEGYVTRYISNTDKRRTLVDPTEKLLELLPEVREVTADWNKLISADIPEADLAVFSAVLERMEKSAKEAIERLGE